MTRKDYIKLAQALRDGARDAQLLAFEKNIMVMTIVECLRDDNPRFNAERFRKACGLTD